MEAVIITGITYGELETLIENSIKRILAAHNIERPPEMEIIDTKEVCKRLAITEPTVLRWRKKKKIPYLNIGSAIRYNWPEVVKALENKRR
jgi:excisionase family DNA binding protein